MYWLAAICVGAIFGGGAFSSADLGFIGVSPAEAKTYYTRKRVDGKWVTGRFAKKSASKKEAASKKEVARGGRSTKSAKRRARAAAFADADAANPSTRVAALPTPKAESAGQATPGPQVSGGSASTQVVPRAATGVSLVPLSEDERLAKLREALRARANALTTGSIAPPRAPEPQSVSLDFRSGTKTTIFSDGTLVTEPFDVGSLKGLAGAFPGSRPALSESAAGTARAAQ
jgi:hypothetical protein